MIEIAVSLGLLGLVAGLWGMLRVSDLRDKLGTVQMMMDEAMSSWDRLDRQANLMNEMTDIVGQQMTELDQQVTTLDERLRALEVTEATLEMANVCTPSTHRWPKRPQLISKPGEELVYYCLQCGSKLVHKVVSGD